jgi:hypothetical protein
MYTFSQQLSDKDLRNALRIHYFGYIYTLITPVLGALISLYFIATMIIQPESFNPSKLLLLIAGLFFILRPRLYITNIFRAIRSQKNAEFPATINLTEDNKIESHVGESSSTISLEELFAYADKQNFLFLYVTRNNFLILDKREMPVGMHEKLISLLLIFRIKKKY